MNECCSGLKSLAGHVCGHKICGSLQQLLQRQQTLRIDLFFEMHLAVYQFAVVVVI
jgi:hypothetical protein